jgi:8-oxo-dGTP pyrophosphatase MutT (NUDIX family)
MTNIYSPAPKDSGQAITACVLMHHNFDGVEKIFLAKRAATKKFYPNVWEIPGGHIEPGESIVDGLHREIMEEFGMHIKIGDPFASFDYYNPTDKTQTIEVVYFASFTDPIEQIKLNDDDHSQYGWFIEDDLPSLCAEQKDEGDREFVAMRKAFSLLRGDKPDFA